MTVWYAGWNPPSIPDSHPHRITSTKCSINTVVSPDDGHVVARNMYRLINILRINILRINCAPSQLYLQDYTGMHGQQNIKSLIQGGSNMTGTDLCVNKPHCAAAVRP